ncbi:MAG TPA: EamA family transporter [Flavisolibacter sp.]|jgi:drug/metabolite transporter (DMT)-like permease|nr:EamA family transporter [Flavisolibacter sp.]
MNSSPADKPSSYTSDPQNTLNVAVRYLSYLNPLQLHKRTRKVKAYFALAMVCFFWGTTWLASRQAVLHMPALQMAGMRQLIGGSCYVLFFLYKGATWPTRREWGSILVLSLLNFLLSNGLSTWGVQYISAGLGSIIGAIFPLWLVVIGLFTHPSELKKRTILGLLIGFAGICIIFYEHLSDFLLPDFRFGIFLSLAATWSWAFGTLYTKKHAAGFNPYFGLGLQMVLSGVTSLGISRAAGLFVPISSIPWQSWAAIGYLVVFGSIISFVAYLYALQYLPTTQLSLYAYINPIVAVFLGSILFGELLTIYIAIGVLVTLVGVYLVKGVDSE